jgi:hypothetical protein
MTLANQFSSINTPSETDLFQFSAIPIYGFENHRIAKDKYGNPTLLLSVAEHSNKNLIADFKLQNVSAYFDFKCKVKQTENVIERKFTVISFIGDDISLRKYFLKLCSALIEDLGNCPNQEELRNEISRFIELLSLAIEPPTKTIQGLWAELFIISECNNPEFLLRCWHLIPEEKYDFNSGEERIEVKSSSTNQRIHNFSLDQLNSPTETKTLIISVFVKQASMGKSILMLQNEISEMVPYKTELIEKMLLQIALTLGSTINDSEKLKFDIQLAKDSIRFYRAEDIPQIEQKNIPLQVTDVHIKSDLSETISISREELLRYGTLFRSI